jgi:rare lipoprotein A (peptidoglycan hydrolase)
VKPGTGGTRRALRRVVVTGVLAAVAPLVCVAGPASGTPTISRADLSRLETRAQALTKTAEDARNAVLDAAMSATDLRTQLDRLADQRDAEQAKVDAALVELYERSVEQIGTQSIGPQLQDINPGLANVYGAGVTQQQSTVDTLDAHAGTLALMSEQAQRYTDLLSAKARRVFTAEDEALTLLATARDEYERLQLAADVARVEAEQQHLRDISNQVSNTVSPGVGQRGAVALSRQAAVLELLNAAGSGYPAGYGPTGQTFDGTSSWYGPGFEGKPTATGAPFDPEKLTAAMKAVPLGTVIHVTFRGRAINLLVNDRGPYVGDRIIDCSRAGSRALGFDGLAGVHIEVLGPLTG